MARQHLSIPNDMMDEVNDICERNSMTRSKFVVRGIQMAIDDARRRFGPAANDPTPTPRTFAPLAPAAGSAATLEDGTIATIKRGDTTWFDMGAICEALSIETESLLGEIDPDDDILNYQGKPWIDQRALAEARTLCRDPQVADALHAWSKTKL